MTSNIGKEVPVKEGLWVAPSHIAEKPQLIGSKCPSCGEIAFPKNEVCVNCQQQTVDEVRLSPRGKIFSLSTVMLQPPRYYRGPVPYAIGFVELPEGVRVPALFVNCNPESLKIGMDVELVVQKLFTDEEGNDIMGYGFAPIK
jgi:uncharacterized OB-fold protein